MKVNIYFQRTARTHNNFTKPNLFYIFNEIVLFDLWCFSMRYIKKQSWIKCLYENLLQSMARDILSYVLCVFSYLLNCRCCQCIYLYVTYIRSGEMLTAKRGEKHKAQNKITSNEKVKKQNKRKRLTVFLVCFVFVFVVHMARIKARLIRNAHLPRFAAAPRINFATN